MLCFTGLLLETVCRSLGAWGSRLGSINIHKIDERGSSVGAAAALSLLNHFETEIGISLESNLNWIV